MKLNRDKDKQHKEELFSNPTYFRSLAGKLQYLTLTKTDIQFAVNFVCQKMHAPTVTNYTYLKQILRYVKGTVTMELSINKNTDFKLTVYSDSDWSGCSNTSRSTGGFNIFLGSNLISWSSKKQPTTEAEYRSISETTSKITWLCLIMNDLGISLPSIPILLCDNLSVVMLIVNPSFHSKTKHFLRDHHYVHERVALGTLEVRHISNKFQIADIFTKESSSRVFSLITKQIWCAPSPNAKFEGG